MNLEPLHEQILYVLGRRWPLADSWPVSTSSSGDVVKALDAWAIHEGRETPAGVLLACYELQYLKLIEQLPGRDVWFLAKAGQAWLSERCLICRQLVGEKRAGLCGKCLDVINRPPAMADRGAQAENGGVH